jgi:phosphoribosylcarboxyaminoimidazole (NCAIR) mutase
MSGGIPVPTFAIGKAGAKNAALSAVAILALQDERLAGKLSDYRQRMAAEVEEQDRKLQQGT